MRAKFVNESDSSELSKLQKEKEKLLKKKEKADLDYEKAYQKQEDFIEKHGESAWWANLDNYDEYLSNYARKNGRYPGFAVWNGEGPIMKAQNKAANLQSDIEYELEEIEKKLSGDYVDDSYQEEDEYIPGVTPYDEDKDYDYAMSHLGYKGPPGGPYKNYYNDLD